MGASVQAAAGGVSDQSHGAISRVAAEIEIERDRFGAVGAESLHFRSEQAGEIDAHRKHLAQFYSGALLIAGLFSFLPGRTMWQWAFA